MWETDIDYIGNNGEQAGAKYEGVKFAAGGHGIQWEVTSGAVLGMIEFQRQGGNVDVSAKIHEARDSIKLDSSLPHSSSICHGWQHQCLAS